MDCDGVIRKGCTDSFVLMENPVTALLRARSYWALRGWCGAAESGATAADLSLEQLSLVLAGAEPATGVAAGGPALGGSGAFAKTAQPAGTSSPATSLGTTIR